MEWNDYIGKKAIMQFKTQGKFKNVPIEVKDCGNHLLIREVDER